MTNMEKLQEVWEVKDLDGVLSMLTDDFEIKMLHTNGLMVKNKFSNNPKVQIIRDFSINAVKMFDDEKFDFIYIDGDHRYQEVLKDLEAWYPKLRYAGVMCGDDYGHPSGIGVIKAVTEFSFKHKLIIHYGEDNQFWFVKV